MGSTKTATASDVVGYAFLVGLGAFAIGCAYGASRGYASGFRDGQKGDYLGARQQAWEDMQKAKALYREL